MLQEMMDKITVRANSILDGLTARGSKRPKALKSQVWKKYGTDHPDKDIITPCLIPIAFIGTKYDEIKDMES